MGIRCSDRGAISVLVIGAIFSTLDMLLRTREQKLSFLCTVLKINLSTLKVLFHGIAVSYFFHNLLKYSILQAAEERMSENRCAFFTTPVKFYGRATKLYEFVRNASFYSFGFTIFS